MKPRKVSRADARVLLAELRSNLWLWRMARLTRQRQSLAMRVRWRLRWLEGTEQQAEALQALQEALEGRRRCSGCGRILHPDTRLQIKARRGLEAR